MSGDEAFEVEALAHLDMLYSVARRLVRTQGEAEDLVQETYTRALSGWRRKPPENVAAWLATICRNIARDSWRRQAVRPQEVWEGEHLSEMISPHDTEASALANLDAEAVHRALWELPEATRQAITMVDLGGMTHEEASRALGVPRGTVLSRVHRGRKALAELIREEVKDHGAHT